MFDLPAFLEKSALILVALLPIILAMVKVWGDLGVKGKWQLVSSLLTGLILGGVVQYFVMAPKTAVDWFAVVLFGILCGLAASGYYEVQKKAATKAAASVLGSKPQGRG